MPFPTALRRARQASAVAITAVGLPIARVDPAPAASEEQVTRASTVLLAQAPVVVWGKTDAIFVADGATPERRNSKRAELHLLEAGHFALETHGPRVAWLIRESLGRKMPSM